MSIQQALQLHHAGRLAEAEQLYRQILAAQPQHYHALHFLGVLRAQLGDMEGSVDLVGRSVALKADDARSQFHLAEALKQLRRYEEAIRHYTRSMELDPGFVPGRIALAGCLVRAGRVHEALACCDEALRLNANQADLYACRGDALQSLKRGDETMQAYDRALALAPGHLAALLGRAGRLLQSGRPEEALAAYDAAIAGNPAAAEPHTGRANALRDLGRIEEAFAAFQQSLARDPTNQDTHYNLGCMLLATNRFEAALAAFDSALAGRPDYMQALYNRAIALEELGREAEALADCEKALSINSDAGLPATKSFFIRALHCDWSQRTQALGELDRLCRNGEILDTFTLLGAFDDPERHLAAARLQAQTPSAPILNARPTAARLRLAYISPNFHFHPVAHQAVALLEAHDRARFETFGICVAPGAETPIRQRLRAAFDHFIEAGDKSDVKLAQLLCELKIDVVVDLAGYTLGGRTTALRYRPAPIAVNWLGYAGTTGASYVDYIIADPVLIPPGAESLYIEQVVRLPGNYMPRDTTEVCEPAPPRSQLGLPEGGVVFCGFNNAFKITPEIFAIWMRLLLAVDGSVLWLNIQDSQARANLCREAVVRAVAPQRLIFAERVAERRDHLSRLEAADLFLDTMPYGAHSTANDMLWCGVPVLTCSGRSFASRVAASMLTVAGLDELIAPDFAAYESLALVLAREPGRLAALRNKLAQNRTALFDVGRFCRGLESAYETMAERHNRGQKPQSFSVTIPGRA